MSESKLINGNQTRGGKRKGAGRKVGSVTRKTREIAEKAHEMGITPLEVMLGTMRELWEKAETKPDPDAEVEHVKGVLMTPLDYRLLAVEVAQKAAPFVHARLATVEGKVDVAVSGRIETITRRIIKPQ
ncbi:hypothetical protein F0160_22630 [Paraburkholderia sp. JPY303]|uniref:hypothetical protein n=1 Tax=Paraburkholderia atlantica TaxID=2654982 RepID=UPI0015916947|nr:hypothetical protein [Paraburkholderia atlantica]NUY33284.1 hypothetical protein [Paraburkholderia atlantica]